MKKNVWWGKTFRFLLACLLMVGQLPFLWAEAHAAPLAMINVSPSSGLITTEAGASTTFDVWLDVSPSSPVTILLSSSNTNEGTIDKTRLDFDGTNFSTHQTVTVSGVDDFIDDADANYSIVTTVSTLAIEYLFVDAEDPQVTNSDNDTAGITVSASSLSIVEGGSTTFQVRLNSQPPPLTSVTINLASSNTSELTVSPGLMTFTTSNWSTNQTATVTSVDNDVDAVSDTQDYTIAITASGAPPYAGPVNVSVSVQDNDTAGVTVNPNGGLSTSEPDVFTTFTVQLNSRPTGDVTIPLASSNLLEGTVSPSQLVFAPNEWNQPKTVTVTGVDDDVEDGPVDYFVELRQITSTDSKYSVINPPNLSVTNQDDDQAAIIVNPVSGLTTSEPNGIATFTVVLGSRPQGNANVTMTLNSDDLSEGDIDKKTLTFTPQNWNTPQVVTITGQDDFIADGPKPYTIVTSSASSPDDPKYNGKLVADVSVTNTDNETPGIIVNPTAGLQTTEALGTATFTIALSSEPTASVTIGLSSSDSSEGTVAPASVVFDATNWNIARTVTVTGVDDTVADGDFVYSISTAPAVSLDLSYNGINAPDPGVTNLDNETVGVIVNPTSGLITTEATGGTATFTVRLAGSPEKNDVTVRLSSSDTTEGTVAPASLLFTPAKWSESQTFTVTGVDDLVDDGDMGYTIQVMIDTQDPAFKKIDPPDVAVTNQNNDLAGILIQPSVGLTTTEAGGSAQFTVVLQSEPNANEVRLNLSSSDTSEGSVAPSLVIFSKNNWNVIQPVTVTGRDDPEDDDDVAYWIVTNKLASTDGKYSAINPQDVLVTNMNDDFKPVSTPDSYKINAKEPLPLVIDAARGVIVNDTDRNGTTPTAVDPIGPSHGTLVLKTDGSFTYMPDSGFAGVDEFTYRAKDDGNLKSDPATVQILVDRQAPTISWKSPVSNGGALVLPRGQSTVLLEANAADNLEAVQQVIFSLWVPDPDPTRGGIWMQLSPIVADPYQLVYPVDRLSCGWNQLIASVWDMAGNKTNTAQPIKLYRYCTYFLPLLKK